MNIEAELVGWWNANADTPAYMGVPADRPEKFVTFERTGGSGERFRDLPIVAVQVWDKSRYEASQAGLAAVGLLRQFALEHPKVGRVGVAGPYNFPDPNAGHPRYQIVATFVTV